jgi:hypothetical protein
LALVLVFVLVLVLGDFFDVGDFFMPVICRKKGD